MKNWLRRIHHVQVQKCKMLLLQATVWGEITAQYHHLYMGEKKRTKNSRVGGGGIVIHFLNI